MSAGLTLKEEMSRDRVIRYLHPIKWIGTSYSRAKCLKFRSLCPCTDLCAWFEDLQTRQRSSCPVSRDRSALPSTFSVSGEMCPSLTASPSRRRSCSRRGCCGMLMGSPALNEDVVIGKWLLTFNFQVLASDSIFFLSVLHCIVIEVILQKNIHIYH